MLGTDIVIIAVLSAAPGVVAPQQTVTESVQVRDVEKVFTSGNLRDKQAWIDKVLLTGMTQKSPRVAAVIAHELETMNRRAWPKLFPGTPVQTSSATEDVGSYYEKLVEACIESRNPVAIPALVGAMNGPGVWNALIEFGTAAVEPVLEALQSEEDALRIQGEARTLAGLIRSSVVTDEQAARAKQELLGRLAVWQHPVACRGLYELALATKDPELRKRVEAIASGAERPNATGDSERQMLRAVAMRVLEANRSPR